MADINTLPGSQWSNVTIPGAIINAGSIPGTVLSTNAKQKLVEASGRTIATTGASEFHIIAPSTGTITNIKFTSKDALATDNTNYVTFAGTNKGQAGAGTTALLAATDANTTKTTGGTAITAYVPRNLTLSGTAGNLAVNSGDLLVITVTASGTLANTLTESSVAVTMIPTT